MKQMYIDAIMVFNPCKLGLGFFKGCGTLKGVSTVTNHTPTLPKFVKCCILDRLSEWGWSYLLASQPKF